MKKKQLHQQQRFIAGMLPWMFWTLVGVLVFFFIAPAIPLIVSLFK